jgi:phage-related protein
MSRIWDTLPMKAARFHPAALQALRGFPLGIRRAFGKAIFDLQQGHAPSGPLSRPMPTVSGGAAELRVRDSDGIYRAFYFVKQADVVLVFHAFVKKAQKTPAREIELGRKRLSEMLK